MNSNFNKFNKYEPSEIYLCNPDRRQICTVIGINSKATIRLNDLSEISLDIPQTIKNQEGKIVNNPCYDLMEARRLLYVTDIGWFEIKKVIETEGDGGCSKNVSAQSHQIILQNKGFASEERVYVFYNSADPLDDDYNPADTKAIPSVVGQLSKQLGIGVDLKYEDVEPVLDYPIWTITYIDPLIRFPNDADGVYRTLEESITNGYDFMINTVEEAYEIIWIFDILHHSIKVKTIGSITTPTSIYLSFDNLMQQVEVTEDSENIITVLNCNGNNLDIRTVNPMGTNYIVNFDYYKDPNGKWMSKELIAALDAWQELYNKQAPIYENLVIELRQVFEEQTRLDNIITRSQLRVDDLLNARDLYITKYPILAETVYEGENSRDINSEYRTIVFSKSATKTCYRRSPEVENANFVFSSADRTSTYEENFNLGYLYFTDDDSSTYCKLVKNEDGLIGFERYGQYDSIVKWCECSENIGVIVIAESVNINECSLDEKSCFNSVGFTKNNEQLFTCYKEPPILNDSGVFVGDGDNITDTFNECYNNQYLYFLDGNTNSYCKLVGSAEVDIENTTATYYASGFVRYIMIKDVSSWIERHETNVRNLQESYNQFDNEAGTIYADMMGISNECNVLKYISKIDYTGNLYRELESYWIEGDYSNDTLAVLDDTPMEDEVDLASELKRDGEKQLAKKSQPNFSFTITSLDFTKMKQFQQFTQQLQLGRTITVEKTSGVLYTPAVTEISFALDNADDFTMTFSNSARLNSNEFTFADLVAESSQVSKNVASNWQDLMSYARNKESISNLIANPLDRALRAGNTNMVNQEFTVDSTGILGRKYLDDSRSSFVDEQMRIINNTILFTDDNWETVKTALGKIYYDYNGKEYCAYGLAAETIIGSLVMSEELNIQNVNSSVLIDKNGILIKQGDKIVFQASDSGNVSISGHIEAKSGYIGDEKNGFAITNNSIVNNLEDEATRFLLSTSMGETEEYTVGDYSRSDWAMLLGSNLGVTQSGDIYANSGHMAGLELVREKNYDKVLKEYETVYEGENSIDEESEYYGGTETSNEETDDMPEIDDDTTIETEPEEVALAAGLYEHNTTNMILPWEEIIANKYLALDDSDSWRVESGKMLVPGENIDEFQNLDGDLIIPSNSEIVEIGYHTFAQCSKLNKITIPQGVVEIDSEAMWNCSNLEEVSLPSTLEYLSQGVFRACTSLEKLVIPDSVEYISSYLLLGCTNIRELTVPFLGGSSTRCEVLGYLFGDLNWDEVSKILPTEQNNKTYYISNSLEKITITGGYIADYAFYNCDYLKEIHILSDCARNSSFYIGREVFYNCKSLESLSVPFIGSAPNNEDGTESNVLGYWFGYNPGATNESIEISSSNEELTCSVDSEEFIDMTECNKTHKRQFIAIYDGEKWNLALEADITRSWIGEYAMGIRVVGTPKTGDIITLNYNADFFFTEQEYSAEGYVYQSHIPTSLKYISIRGGTIYRGAFHKCSCVKEINLGSLITSIEDNAFLDCESLLSFIADENNISCDHIGSDIFKGCSSLRVAKLPKVINSVGKNVFYGCENIAEIVVPYCGNGADLYGEGTSLSYLFGGLTESNGIYTDIVYQSDEDTWTYTDLYMPTSLVSVKILQGNVFSYGLAYYKTIQNIVLGCDVVNIGANAFFRNSLYNLTIEENSLIKNVEKQAFSECANLLSADFSMCNNLVGIGTEAFYNCPHLEVIKIPKSVVAMGEHCFHWCKHLRELVIPFCGSGSGSTILETSLAYNLGSNWLTEDSNFYNRWGKMYEDGYSKTHVIPKSLDKITILNGVIYSKAFYNYPNKSTIILGEDVTAIEENAFATSNITYLDMSSNNKITSISSSAFYECTDLFEIKLSKNLNSIQKTAFGECYKLHTIIIPTDSKLEIIGERAFEDCSSLYTFNIPNSLTTILNQAFKRCSGLTKMFIPKTVIDVGDFIFSGCSSLSVFVEYAYVPDTYSSAWIDNNCNIRVTYNCARSMYGMFNMNTRAKCYNVVPTYDTNRESYIYDSSLQSYDGELINAYNSGYIYFLDSDKQSYCKMIYNNNRYGFIRYRYTDSEVFYSKFKGSNFELSSMPTASDGIYTSIICYDNNRKVTLMLNTDGLTCNNASIDYLNASEINNGKIQTSNILVGSSLQLQNNSILTQTSDGGKVGLVFAKETSGEFSYVAQLSLQPDDKMGVPDEKLMINITDTDGEKVVLQEPMTFTVYYRRKGGDKRSVSIYISAFSSYGECIIDKKWANFDIAWYSFDSYNHSVHTYCFSQGEPNISNNLGVYGNLIPLQSGAYTLGDANHLWDTIYAASDTINTSDKNRKNNIKSMSDIYSDLFDMLRPVTFKYNEGSSDRTHMGLIANELKEAIEAVGLTTKDVAAYCSWLDNNGDETCGIRYGELIPLSIYEIKKLKARVAELEQQLKNLNN